MGVFQRLRNVAIGRTRPAHRHHINNAPAINSYRADNITALALIRAADNPLSMLISACSRRISCR